MAKRVELYLRLREKGMTYEEIGAIFGVTKQAVHDTIANNRDGFYETGVRKIKYVGLRNWMQANRTNITTLADICSISRPTLYNNVVNKNDMRKSTIDAILAATGLTYEECFKEDEK